jgi:hypothetical protein
MARAAQPEPKQVAYALELSPRTATLAKARTERIIKTVIGMKHSLTEDEFAARGSRAGFGTP